MIKTMELSERDTCFQVADLMVTAALTAPKGSGRDTVVGAVISGEDKDKLAETMKKLGELYKEDFIIRDSANVDSSTCVVVLGCKAVPMGLPNCGLCGFKNCGEMKKAGSNCVFNVTDLGIAVGSAVSVAADHRIDNRVMYSIGIAARDMGIFSEDVKVCWGIPLNSTSKSIYFDRGPGAVLR